MASDAPFSVAIGIAPAEAVQRPRPVANATAPASAILIRVFMASSYLAANMLYTVATESSLNGTFIAHSS